MAWRIEGHPKTQQVTKALAEKFNTMDAVPNERPMSEIRLKVYAELMGQGKFRPMTWAGAYCKATGGTYRVNGQHTSNLCSSLPLKDMPPLYTVVEWYSCDTPEDVAELYSTFDSKMNSRTVTDINRAFAGCIPSLDGIDIRILNNCVSGMSYAYNPGSYHKIQPQERAEALIEHHDFVSWVASLLSPRSQYQYLTRVPVVAAMYLTWQKAPRVATTFWVEVKTESGSTPDLPTRKLSRFLLTHSRQHGDNVKKSNVVTAKEFHVKCLHAWNAYRANEATNLAYYAAADVPSAK